MMLMKNISWCEFYDMVITEEIECDDYVVDCSRQIKKFIRKGHLDSVSHRVCHLRCDALGVIDSCVDISDIVLNRNYMLTVPKSSRYTMCRFDKSVSSGITIRAHRIGYLTRACKDALFGR